jgi:uncharacterized membrane protein YhaH (DUF805 family)
MDWVWFLFRFEGRINRAKYWLAALIILCWMIFVLMVLAAVASIFGLGGPLSIDVLGISASIQFTDDGPSSKASLFPQIVTIPMTLVFAWCYAAVSIKRLHDRNKSGWWIVPLIVAPGLYGHFGYLLGASYPALFIWVAVYVALLWGFVELCFLKGTRGYNRFGADPLPKTQTRPRSGQTRSSSSSGWNQHNELELVPHRAGPSAGA